MKQKVLVAGCGFVLLVAAVVGGWLLRGAYDGQPNGKRQQLLQQYPLLSRRILTDSPNDIIINFVPLRKQIDAAFNGITAKKSFYFEYLPDGTSIKNGADQELIAASLIKVPLAMNLYRAAELGKVDLNTKVTITDDERDGGYGDLWQSPAGTQLTLRQAAQAALEQSDNTAAHIMYDAVHGLLGADDESLARLDIEQNTENGQAVITAKSYSSVLKSLYFASYLNRSDSQELLGYLTHSAAKDRITKYLPGDIPVAHKNGVNNTSWSESDCGIVYIPKRPYILCMMIGLPDEQASQFMATISRQVYDFVNQQ